MDGVPDGTLLELRVGDEPSSWRSLGFAVEGDTVHLDGVAIHLVGEGEGRGIRSWSLAGIDRPIDGIASHPARAIDRQHTAHDNLITGIDHVVVFTDDVGRTLAAVGEAGLEVRRIRDLEGPNGPMQQAFVWLGHVILEIAGSPNPAPDAEGRAKLWGLACTAEDLDAAATVLGDRTGRVKTAVQPGRRITTLKTRELGASVSIALMSPHAD